MKALGFRRLDAQGEKKRLLFEREVHKRNAQRSPETCSRLRDHPAEPFAVQKDFADIGFLVKNQVGANRGAMVVGGELIEAGACFGHKVSQACLIARMCSGVVPQQPPRTQAPSGRTLRANAPIASGCSE